MDEQGLVQKWCLKNHVEYRLFKDAFCNTNNKY